MEVLHTPSATYSVPVKRFSRRLSCDSLLAPTMDGIDPVKKFVPMLKTPSSQRKRRTMLSAKNDNERGALSEGHAYLNLNFVLAQRKATFHLIRC